jgi:hypothetical protein
MCVHFFLSQLRHDPTTGLLVSWHPTTGEFVRDSGRLANNAEGKRLGVLGVHFVRRTVSGWFGRNVPPEQTWTTAGSLRLGDIDRLANLHLRVDLRQTLFNIVDAMTAEKHLALQQERRPEGLSPAQCARRDALRLDFQRAFHLDLARLTTEAELGLTDLNQPRGWFETINADRKNLTISLVSANLDIVAEEWKNHLDYEVGGQGTLEVAKQHRWEAWRRQIVLAAMCVSGVSGGLYYFFGKK